MNVTRKMVLGMIATALTVSVYAQDAETDMMTNAVKYLDAPYVAHTLEVDGEEDLVINCDEVDCTTLVEYVLAESMTPVVDGVMSEGAFADNVIKVRYRNGKIDGYTSRLHYIADWVNNGVRNGFLEDVTAANGTATKKLDLHFMTSHPDKYKQLANSPENVATMKKIEQSLNGQTVRYLPKEDLPHNGKAWIKNGDIIALMTNIDGLDVSHLGIAFYAEGTLTLLHASSTEGKVVVSKRSLAQMMANSNNWIGIRVLRLKK